MSCLRESFRFLHTDRWFSEEDKLWLFPINSSLKTSTAARCFGCFEHAHLNIRQLKLNRMSWWARTSNKGNFSYLLHDIKNKKSKRHVKTLVSFLVVNCYSSNSNTFWFLTVNYACVFCCILNSRMCWRISKIPYWNLHDWQMSGLIF